MKNINVIVENINGDLEVRKSKVEYIGKDVIVTVRLDEELIKYKITKNDFNFIIEKTKETPDRAVGLRFLKNLSFEIEL